MTDILTIIIIGITFFLAGGIKGIVGLGLPTISLALLAVMFDLVTAIILTLIPSLVTNIWQALSGTGNKVILKRILPFLIMALIAIWFGAYILSSQNMTLLFFYFWQAQKMDRGITRFIEWNDYRYVWSIYRTKRDVFSGNRFTSR
jgi:uncharacterized membrane protein YfcA